MSNTYDIGDMVSMTASFKDSSGSMFVDPTTLTFTLLKPDKSTVQYVYGTNAELIRDALGKYRVDYVPTVSGNYHYRFAGTGSAQVADEGYFTVKRSDIL